MEFSDKVDIKTLGTNDFILVLIGFTTWIQKCFKGFSIIALISNIGAFGPWQKFALSKCL